MTAPTTTPSTITDQVLTLTVNGQRYLYTALTNEIFRIPDQFPVTDDMVGTLLAQKSTVYDTPPDTDRLDADDFGVGFGGYHDKSVDEYRDERLSSIVIGLTHDCNLRCTYCLYDETNPDRRDHARTYTDPDTVERGIDNVVSTMDTGDTLSIVFYGGEPVLAIDTLKHAVTYVTETIDVNGDYYIVTNGRMLTPDTIDYFVQHDFDFFISLDGPAHIHDAQRPQRDGDGSFDAITDALTYFESTYPDYYRSHVSFQATLTPPYEYIELDDFFSTHPLVAENDVSINWMVRDGVIPDDNKFDTDAFTTLKTRYLDALENGTPGDVPIGDAIFGSKLSTFEQRHMTVTHDTMYPHAMCVPGADKQFVDVDGTYGMCQRVDDYALGDVDTGFDADKADAALDQYVTEMTADCADCWMQRFCTSCYPKFFINGEFSDRKQTHTCTHQRTQYAEALDVFLRAKQRGVDKQTILDAGASFGADDTDPNAF